MDNGVDRRKDYRLDSKVHFTAQVSYHAMLKKLFSEYICWMLPSFLKHPSISMCNTAWNRVRLCALPPVDGGIIFLA